MEPVPCFHCATMFIPRNLKQYCCSRPECKRARKANWQRIKMKTDPDYRTAQKLSNQKWADKNPDYWRTYREQNPEKALRNRMLQAIRNRRRPVGKKFEGLPIAKMDATKVNIYANSDISLPYRPLWVYGQDLGTRAYFDRRGDSLIQGVFSLKKRKIRTGQEAFGRMDAERLCSRMVIGMKFIKGLVAAYVTRFPQVGRLFEILHQDWQSI